MHEILWFVHWVGTALWLGSLVAGILVAASALRAEQGALRAWGLSLTQRIGAGLSIPASVVVLVAGVAMVLSGGMVGTAKPLWFQVMEMGGGTLVLVSIAPLVWMGRRMVRLATANGEAALTAARTYVGALTAVALCQAAVVLTVSLRLN